MVGGGEWGGGRRGGFVGDGRDVDVGRDATRGNGLVADGRQRTQHHLGGLL